ncbi:MAG TPA: carboxyl transferase domain-containing protein [Bacillota bacterium]|nr:carboxyl transferase domain-containing protein [Bacillota bacterium]
MKPEENAGSKKACEKLMSLFDAGTFAQFGEYVTRPESDEREGVICGCGAVNGRLVYAFYEDFSSLKGAVDAAHLRKINNLYQLAEKNGAPIVSFLNSAGAAVCEGIGLLSAYGDLFANAARLSGSILQIAVVNGVCTGSQAVYASMNDFVIIAGKDSTFSFAPSSVLKASGAAKNAPASIICDDEISAVANVRDLISILPSCCDEQVEGDADDVNRAIELSQDASADEAAAAVADFGKLTEINAGCCGCVKTYIATVAGKACGFICLNDNVGEKGLAKASALVKFCDAFSLPIITFVDCAGMSSENEAAGGDIAGAAGKFAAIAADASTAKIAVVCGKAYGAAFTLFASKALYDVVYALDCSVISVMAPESAVEFVKNDVIAASSTPDATRQELIAAWKNSEASPYNAASQGCIDSVIESADILKYVAFSVEMMSSKRVSCADKKHISK